MTSWSSFLQQNLPQIQKYLPATWKQPPKPKKLDPISSLSSSLRSLTNLQNLSQSFKTYTLLQHHISSSTSSHSLTTLHSLCSLLTCCNTLKAFPQATQLHAHIITLGFENNHVLLPKLVSLYTNFSLFNHAFRLALHSNTTSCFSWNILISSYVKHGFCREGINVYKQMISLGVQCDKYTYPSLLKACGEELDMELGKEMHKRIIHNCNVELDLDLDLDLYVHNALIVMYVKFGDIGNARNVFDKMLVRDVVTWNSMVMGYAEKGMWECVYELFDLMRVWNVEMNVVTWNVVAGGCLENGNFRGVFELIGQMIGNGVGLDCVTVVIGLGACAEIGSFEVGKSFHGYAVRRCYDGVENVKNALIIMYSKCNDLEHARLLFRSTECKSLVTWNSMIAGCIHLEQYEEACFIFREMISIGIRPNYVTIASILPFCARTLNLLHGKEIHGYVIKANNLNSHLVLWNCIVDLYSKSGKIMDARVVFNSMSEKDKVTYTSLIAGYGMQGHGQTALKLFEEMNGHRIEPDHITMIAVLSACSHSGLVLEGQMLFEKMISTYKINPLIEHFACMVDLYGTAGCLGKAAQTIIEMPFQPTPVMLVTLIRACRIHGNTTILEWAMKLLEMRQEG